MLCGWLGEIYGWGYGFGAAGIDMIDGLANFILGQKYLHGHAEPRDPVRLCERIFDPLSREHLISLAPFAGLVVIWGLIQSYSRQKLASTAASAAAWRAPHHAATQALDARCALTTVITPCA